MGKDQQVCALQIPETEIHQTVMTTSSLWSKHFCASQELCFCWEAESGDCGFFPHRFVSSLLAQPQSVRWKRKGMQNPYFHRRILDPCQERRFCGQEREKNQKDSGRK